MDKIELYDTTLRDGAQYEGISFSVEDKLSITETLDDLGVHYVEGGWPGSNPKDALFLDRYRHTLGLCRGTGPRGCISPKIGDATATSGRSWCLGGAFGAIAAGRR